jgi:hypothetical protein
MKRQKYHAPEIVASKYHSHEENNCEFDLSAKAGLADRNSPRTSLDAQRKENHRERTGPLRSIVTIPVLPPVCTCGGHAAGQVF